MTPSSGRDGAEREPQVRLTIDGVQVAVAPGTNVVDAAHSVGIEIPIFCHHPRLEPVGMCRMCLVEVGTPAIDRETGAPVVGDDGSPVIRFFPGPVPGCTTPVSEGMVVRTDTEAVADERRGVIEFLLTSHPLDCPVCDKGGECPLQNQTMRYGPGRSRFAWSDKQHFDKPVALGPLITLDRERCVLCARCVRFEDEIAGDQVLGLANRGRGMEVISESDPPFDSRFSGNTTDICPVGALTGTDFRFAARVWEMVGTPGVCTHCPVGCNVTYDSRHGRILRVMPRENDDVNEIWLCDKGRYGAHYVAAAERLTSPLVRREGELVPASWQEAVAAVADGLAAACGRHGPAAVGGIASGLSPNEDLYAFGRFLRAVVGTNNVDHAPSVIRDDLAIRCGLPPESSLTGLGAGDVVLVAGLDVEEEAPLLLLNLLKAQRNGARLLTLNGRPTKLDRFADVSLRYRYGGEDDVLAALLQAMLARSVPAESPSGEEATDALRAAVRAYDSDVLAGVHPIRADELQEAATAIREATDLVVAYGRDAVAARLAPALAALVTATGHVGRPNNGLLAIGPLANSQGAADMGVLPHMLPGYQPLTSDGARGALAGAWPRAPEPEPGLAAPDMLAGRVKALYLLRSDPLGDDPALRPALDDLDLLVVQDLFLTETALRASVVLPDTAWPERQGSATSFARRVQQFMPAVPPPGQAREGWRILVDVEEELRGSVSGAVQADWSGPTWASATDVTDEIARLVPGYAGLTAAALGAVSDAPVDLPPAGLPFAPRTDARSVSYSGTSYVNDFGTGLVWPLGTTESGGSEEGVEAAAVGPPAVGTGAGLDWRPSAQGPAGGLILVPTTLLLDGGPQMRGAEVLGLLVPPPHVAMSPFDAGPLGLRDGDRVLVVSPGGSLRAELRLRDHLTPGVVLAPEHLAWDGATPRTVLEDRPWCPVTVERAE
ncbi:MAG: NADH-quinone oxidoreductase subunit NuoG [Anaerolineae bacterium]